MAPTLVQYARNLQDAAVAAVTWTLSATTGTATKSGIIDIGSEVIFPEGFEIEVAVPALPNAIVSQGAVNQIGFETSTSSTFGTVSRSIVDIITVSDTAGLPVQALRYRIPSTSGRYFRGTVNLNTSATAGGATAATYVAQITPLF